ncbi:hypothetical protein PCC7424_5255 [Gloeothece citriformis PCC 7424]|uniref:Uncharacterized protein n=1 Tax=Gloeothece citriformis (strain PCC 7424) TaxID=65393 RepID=B7KIB6_GLOC7|nr:hypothetical protein PCC7424_5255 [Gloeothece citriformis PCC 7424]
MVKEKVKAYINVTQILQKSQEQNPSIPNTILLKSLFFLYVQLLKV